MVAIVVIDYCSGCCRGMQLPAVVVYVVVMAVVVTIVVVARSSGCFSGSCML